MENFLDLLSSPPAERGPVPFWFLNDRLSRWEIRSQLTDFHQHGVPGVVIHPRMGFDAGVPYLSERYMDWMEFICETARSLSMFVYLYDEGMYPSGSACGQVVRENPVFAAKALEWSDDACETDRTVALFALPLTAEGKPDPQRARIIHDASECLAGEVVRSAVCVDSGGTIRGLHPDEDDGAPNAPAAADLLNPDAVACFIRLTHERYWARLKRFFGSTIRAMFTDEPNPLGRNTRPGLISWTKGMETEWTASGYPLEDLPLLFLPGERAAAVRAHHARLIRTHMMRSYYQPLKDWCDQHGIALTGHPAWPDAMDMEEAFSIPGQDLVWGWVAKGETSLSGPESTLAQCAADSALHSGRPVSLCECFGCCGPRESQWGMTMSDIKWMSDWLFVRGISQLVPHAFFYSLRLPEARADRPPDVGPNNIFWPFYLDFSTYCARLSTLNEGRFSLAETAVLTDAVFLDASVSRELYVRQIPFHYLPVSQFLEASAEDGCLHLPGQNVSMLIVPLSLGLTNALQDHLHAFSRSGGTVLCTDDPGWTDALSAARRPMLFEHAPDLRVSWQERDGDEYILLTNEGDAFSTSFELSRKRHVQLMDSWTGRRTDLGCTSQGKLQLAALESLIICLSAPEDASSVPSPEVIWEELDVTEYLSAPEKNGTHAQQLNYTLTLPARAIHGPVYLCFEKVHDMAVLSAEGMQAHLLIAPWRLELPQTLSARGGTIHICVTGARVTEMDGIPWPCGLEGSVFLRYPRQKN